MRKLVSTCIAAGAFAVAGHAQTLFTYGPNSVSKDEFLRVYKKNSINKKPDMSEKELRSYLDLYTLFRMKVAEADKQHLDTVASIDRELTNYRKQLAKNYLTDEQITNKLVREAYDRMKEDVRVSHILVSCPPGSDTLLARKKMDSIATVVASGKQSFEAMAAQFSDDKGSKDHGGDLGYFTALQVIYPLENMAYTTPKGKVSGVFRTQFGYHILKVTDRRPNKGEVKVAQIMIQIMKAKGDEGVAEARKRADSVMAMLKAGTPFYTLVEKYSDDKYTVNDSGVMKPFGVGKMVPEFEDAAFGIKKPGEIAGPVRTEYGFHIIKLIAKTPLQPYDSMHTQLKRKVDNDSRAQMARDIYYDKVKAKNGFKEYPENFTEVFNKLQTTPDTGVDAKSIKAEDYRNMNKTLFTLGGKNYLQSDFVAFLYNLTRGKLNGPKNAVVRDAYNLYMTNVVTDFQEHKLVDENPEFKTLMAEYRDGIMLFELMDRNVWSKASKDTVGLKAFFETRKGKYMWEPGFEGAVYKFKDKASFDAGMEMIKTGKYTEDSIAKAVNTAARPDGVSIQRGHYEFSRYKDATLAELSANKIKVIPGENGATTVVVAKQVYSAPTAKTLDEARGYVVAEYQDHLEKQWNEKMRSDYPVKVNEQVFKSMVK
ncbi:peptidylprolyl isomerase [Nemorincola caseinilytica]|uniref:Peptidylprolyl isomerase n=1 Tax=Nemorincola caseinilytica TaxID=2054315 RepID=A0ABP8NL20_9BACT